MHKENLKNEIYRKLIHLSSMWVPILLLTQGRQVTLTITFILLIFMAIFEGFRQKSKIINKIVTKFSLVFRKSELDGSITGASYFLLGCFLVTLFSPSFIAFIAMLILIISDSLAAIIGKKWGKIKFNNKTLEGSGAFLISAIVISVLGNIFLNQSLFGIANIIISCFAATFFELYAKNIKIDDNLLIPLSFASFMQILS